LSPEQPHLPVLAVDVASGLLRGVRWVESPNHDARPAGSAPDLIVIHGISLPPGAFGGPWIDQLFTNRLDGDEHPYFDEVRSQRVSAHVLLCRDGRVTQYVRFQDRAWHAGKSSYAGRDACNDFSVGIELEGTDTTPYEDVQYRVLANLVAALLAAYPTLSLARITGHADIAPGRKTDPGAAFDWPRARRLIAMAAARLPS